MVMNQLLGPVSMLNPESIESSEFLKAHETHYANLSGFAVTPVADKLPTVSIDCTTVASPAVSFNKFQFRFNSATNEVSFSFRRRDQIESGCLEILRSLRSLENFTLVFPLPVARRIVH